VALALVVAVAGQPGGMSGAISVSSTGGKAGKSDKVDKPDKPGKHFSREDKVKLRKIKFLSGDHSVAVVCNSLDGVKGSRLEFGFSTLGFPRFRARYFNHTQAAKAKSDAPDNDDGHDNKASPAKEMYKFRVGIQTVLEFNDTNGNGQFDVDERDAKHVLQRFKLWGVGPNQWSKIPKPTADSVTADGLSFSTTISQSAQTGTPLGGTASLTLTLGIADGVVEDYARNRTLQPNAFKFDIDLDNWTYKGGQGSLLAFVFRIDSKTRVTGAANLDASSDISSDAGFAVGNGGHFGWVSQVMGSATQGAALFPYTIGAGTVWDETADDLMTHASGDDDDNDIDVTESKQLVAFVVQNNADGSRPTSVHWDPSAVINDDYLDTETGSDDNTPNNAAPLSAAAALFTAAAAAAALL